VQGAFSHAGDILKKENIIGSIVRQNSFETLTGGRKEGEENSSSFFRKGTSGDWKNHFTSEIKEQFKSIVGDQLISLGYEEDLNW
jgi:hypothetical protein